MNNYSWLLFSLFCLSGKAEIVNHWQQKISITSDDTAKVSQLLSRADQLSATNKDSSLYYIQQALLLSEKLNYRKGLMEANSKAGDLRVKMNQRDKAGEYYLMALNIAQDLNNLNWERALFVKVGNQFYLEGKYGLAEEYYLRALSINNKNQEERIKIFTNLGMTYTRLADYSKAFDALAKSNRISDSVSIHKYVGGNYIDIAVLMGLEEKYGEALYYYDKAATELKKEKDSVMVGYAYLGKGEVYMQMGSYQQAINFFRSIDKYLYESSQQFNLHQNLGISLRAINKLKESEQSFLEAQQINEDQIQHFYYRLSNYIELARLYKQSGQRDQAIDLAHKAGLLAKKNGLLSNYKDCLQLLSSLYESRGNLNKALLYQKEYSTILDSIGRIDQTKKLAEAETRFRLGEKNKEVELLGKENEMSRLREQSDRAIMLALLGGLVILIVAAIIIARAYQRTKAKNELLDLQKTEIEQANRVISDQAAKLQASDKMKSRFFANVSHELRTPVTLINGMLEFIAEEETVPKKKEQINIALGNSHKLTALVEEMLDLTKLEVNKVVLKKRVVSLQPLLNRILNSFSPLLEKKKIRLIHDSQYGQTIHLELDESKFEKIINNLIYNAIKFTPEGGWIRINKRNTDENVVEIQISDSGIGIPEQDLPHIFERFYQSESGLQKHDEQGTGIGLSLVKEFTQLHGGNVRVDSKAGEGAAFTLCFPVINLPDNQQEEFDGEFEFTQAEYKRPPDILLVEDHEEMRNYLSEVLGNRFNIKTASDGQEALRWLVANPADLILSDVMMPVMDGYTLLTYLKENEKWSQIPVIMLTARAAEEDRLEGLRLGVDDYLTKPFNANELRARVQNVLLNQASRREWLLKSEGEHETVNENGEQHLFMDKVIAYVESRIKDPLISVSDLASHLAISERQLYRKAGELTGLAPAQLIKEVRLRKAYQLLTKGEVSKLSVLANEVGYETAAYFSRQFAERFGKKPSEFL